jgi:hypothetical protein
MNTAVVIKQVQEQEFQAESLVMYHEAGQIIIGVIVTIENDVARVKTSEGIVEVGVERLTVR